MDIGFRRLRKALEKILHQLYLEIADASCRDLGLYDAVRPSAKIHSSGGKRFVYGHGGSLSGTDIQNGVFHSFRIVFSKRRISDCVPMVMRTNPGLMSLLRSRRRIPCFSSFRNNTGPLGPKFTRIKFPALG